jgi:hypothetical protein
MSTSSCGVKALAKQFFAQAPAVELGRVDVVDAEVDRAAQ